MKKNILQFVMIVIVSMLVGLTISHFIGGIVSVSGTSMEPTLKNRERVMLYRLAKPNRNDVIVFESKGVDPNVSAHKDYVKRVIGVPGDTVRYSKEGTLYVNNKRVTQNYLSEQEKTVGTLNTYTDDYSKTGFDLNSLSNTQDWKIKVKNNKVPKGYFFVMGDHRSVSNDGRYWGFVPKSKVAGVVHVFFWQNSLR